MEIVGTPFAKGYLQEDQSVKAEIRLNVSKTNILRPAKADEKIHFDFEEIENEVEDNYSPEDALEWRSMASKSSPTDTSSKGESRFKSAFAERVIFVPIDVWIYSTEQELHLYAGLNPCRNYDARRATGLR